ncbi:HAD-like domain-containing protein [Coniella lustricola]|uniref:HAD-like domain-containing protein n=1 Tax=Coniella lustricola TaxID=2025994 RepID=A0A2T3AEE1_9PEZI|nr:HAD-like domain-containing protein [Coniella lustricola]
MSALARARVLVPGSKHVASLSRSFSQSARRFPVSRSIKHKTAASFRPSLPVAVPCDWSVGCHGVVRLYSSSPPAQQPNLAFAFDIDGVLLHKSEPIEGATATLKYLQQHEIPFIFLTNGGGKPEAKRVAELSEKLGVPLNTSNFVQSHTPYQLLTQENFNGVKDSELAGLITYLRDNVGVDHLRDSTVLVLGSDASVARRVAHGYGFTSVITSGDILAAHPEIFPFDPLSEFYAKQEILPLPKPLYDPKKMDNSMLRDCLKIDAVLVFNDPRDWAVDIQLITDLLLSHRGYLGTWSFLNGKVQKNKALAEGKEGRAKTKYHKKLAKLAAQWQSDGQPAVVFSNCDLLWSTGYQIPRFGQGAFRNAVHAQFQAIVADSDGYKKDKTRYELRDFTFGKPHHAAYAYAQKVMLEQFEKLRQDRPPPASSSSAAATETTTTGLEGEVQQQDGSNEHVAEGTPPSSPSLQRQGQGQPPKKSVWMIGDNLMSDIWGANKWNQHFNSRHVRTKTAQGQHMAIKWQACLVETGVWSKDRAPLNRQAEINKPQMVQKDVKSAVNAIFEKENWPGRIE